MRPQMPTPTSPTVNNFENRIASSARLNSLHRSTGGFGRYGTPLAGDIEEFHFRGLQQTLDILLVFRSLLFPRPIGGDLFSHGLEGHGGGIGAFLIARLVG